MRYIIRYLLYILTGALVFHVMYSMVNTELIYHQQQLGFASSHSFFWETIRSPGGVAKYISLFLFQYTYNYFTGALVYSALVIAILFFSGFLLGRWRSVIEGVLVFIPALYTSILMADYSFNPVYPVLMLLLMFFVLLYTAIVRSKGGPTIKFILSLLLFALFYFLAGGGVFLVFCLSVLLWLLWNTQGKTLFYSYITVPALAVTVPFIYSHFFKLEMQEAFFRLGPVIYWNNQYGFRFYVLFLSLPIMMFVHFIFRFKQVEGAIKKTFIRSMAWQNSLTLILVGVLGISLYSNVDYKTKAKLTIDKMAYERKWDELLAYAEEHPLEDRLVQFQVNRALYFTGAMTEKLFFYNQKWGVDGLFLTRDSGEMSLPSIELCVDLAYPGEAIRLGCEALSSADNSPLIIEQLIWAYIIADSLDLAQLRINELKDYPLFRRKAKRLDRYLNGEEDSVLNELLLAKRAIMPFSAFKSNAGRPSDDLLNILVDRPQNKMAYEYLMSYYLLNHDLPSFVKYYSIGRKFNYEKVPSIFQQALILYSYEHSRQGRVFGMRYDKEIASQFNDFHAILGKHDNDLEVSLPEIIEKYRNTYWFYVYYNRPLEIRKQAADAI